MNPSTVESQVRFESAINFSMPAVSSKMTRWERKKAAKAASSAMVEKTNTATPKRGLKRSLSSMSSSGTPQSAKRSARKRQACEDRFIHSRGSMCTDELHSHLTQQSVANNDTENEQKKADSPNTKAYKATLKRELSGGTETNGHRVLAYTKRTTVPVETQRMGNVLYSQNKTDMGKRVQKTTMRHIPDQPERILDAPDLESDYYLNLLDWSAQNVLAVALGPTVYLWNATNGSIQELCTLDETESGPMDKVCSVSWVPGDGNFLAVGTSNNVVQLWDVNECKKLRSMDGHQDRVSSLAWNKHVGCQ